MMEDMSWMTLRTSWKNVRTFWASISIHKYHKSDPYISTKSVKSSSVGDSEGHHVA